MMGETGFWIGIIIMIGSLILAGAIIKDAIEREASRPKKCLSGEIYTYYEEEGAGMWISDRVRCRPRQEVSE